MRFLDRIFRKKSKDNMSTLELFSMVRKTPVKHSLRVDKQPKETRELVKIINLHCLTNPTAKEEFIARGLELARSSNLDDKFRTWFLFVTWVNDNDSRIDFALETDLKPLHKYADQD